MTAPIGPGDWVECVDVAPRSDNPRILNVLMQLSVGAMYRVNDVGLRNTIMLHGVVAAYEHDGVGWWADRFRPIYRPKQELIESLKVPAKRTRKREAA